LSCESARGSLEIQPIWATPINKKVVRECSDRSSPLIDHSLIYESEFSESQVSKPPRR
jgi:hypothetical protein